MTVTADERDHVLQSLDRDPGPALVLLADRLDQLHRGMAPRAQLTYRVAERSFTAGRHEIPALALLFRSYGVAAEADVDAVERARGLALTGEVRPPA
ncbi:hypothetical protein ACFV9C_33420 [Kribbella sp. NPDC059898]|uniref:hypothetical protein n=1 Tax=Kribbella sp. NPDC059898 TaxID=3346995 RepID=UPI00364EA4E6